MHRFHTSRRVEFADTDMAGIVHFARFFVYMETAEHEFLRAAGTPAIHFEHHGHRIGWPRVETWCRFKSPARVDEVLDIEVRVRRKGRTSMTYDFTFRHRERLVAEGRISAICCILDDPEGLRPTPIPPFLADAIEPAPPAGDDID